MQSQHHTNVKKTFVFEVENNGSQQSFSFLLWWKLGRLKKCFLCTQKGNNSFTKGAYVLRKWDVGICFSTARYFCQKNKGEDNTRKTPPDVAIKTGREI